MVNDCRSDMSPVNNSDSEHTMFSIFLPTYVHAPTYPTLPHPILPFSTTFYLFFGGGKTMPQLPRAQTTLRGINPGPNTLHYPTLHYMRPIHIPNHTVPALGTQVGRVASGRVSTLVLAGLWSTRTLVDSILVNSHLLIGQFAPWSIN